jgi:hypothetical protein
VYVQYFPFPPADETGSKQPHESGEAYIFRPGGADGVMQRFIERLATGEFLMADYPRGDFCRLRPLQAVCVLFVADYQRNACREIRPGAGVNQRLEVAAVS